jgi:hypothetical protein
MSAKVMRALFASAHWRGHCANQRLAMYIVISKPKRMSVKAGVVHCMFVLLGAIGIDDHVD